MKNNKSFGYYFLHKRLHPRVDKNFKISIILMIVNKNNSKNNGKILFVQQKSLFWNLPKRGIKSKDIAEDVFTTISKNLENELGFKGIKVFETKPLFRQIALIFDFDKQMYDSERTIYELKKNNPSKGKIYQLAIMEYRGPDIIPISADSEVLDYKWVNEEEAGNLMLSNKQLLDKNIITSKESILFNIELFKKIVFFYNKLYEGMEFNNQPKLL